MSQFIKEKDSRLKIGILNAYDARNRGDQAIVLCQMELLKRKFQNVEFLVFSRQAMTNASVLDGPSVTSVESLLHVPPGGNPLVRLLHPLWDLLRWWLGSRSGKFGKFRSCDLYVLCGGGYLYSSHSPVISRNLACICLEILIAAGTGRPVFQFPQSFGSITKAIDRWLVLKVCRTLPHLTPRTQVAYNHLAEWGFASKSVVMPDTVLSMHHLLPELYPATKTRTGLGVAPVNYTFAMKLTGAEHVKYVNDLAEVCGYYHQKTGEAIHLFTQVCLPGDDDSVVVNELAAKLERLGVPFHKVPEQADLKAYISAVSGMRAVISARMHACIFALTARVPVIGLAYQPKFIGLYQLMKLDDWVCPLDNWTVEWACRRLDEILDSTNNPTPKIEEQITDLEHQLSRHMDAILPGDRASCAARAPADQGGGFPPAQWLVLCRQLKNWATSRSLAGYADSLPQPHRRAGQAVTLIVATFYLAVIVCLHLCISPHMTLVPLYLIPCIFLALTVNVRWATIFAIVTSLMAPLIQYFGDTDYQSPVVLIWNFLMRFLLAEFLVLIFARIRRDIPARDELGWQHGHPHS